MQKSDKISNSQLALILVVGVLPTSLMGLPAIITEHAGTDSWISIIIAALIGFIVIAMSVALCKMYPGKTIIEFSEVIAGKIAGKIIGFIFFWFFLYLTSIVLREFVEFQIAASTPDIPKSIIMVTFLMLIIYTANFGLEVIARTTVIIFAVLMFSFILVTLLSLTNMDLSNMLPILSKGIMPPIKGSFAPAGWIGETVCIAFLFPYLNKQEKGMKAGITAIAILAAFFMVAEISSLLIFGSQQTAEMHYPTYTVAKYVDIKGILERSEVITSLVLVAGSFTKLSIYFYVTAMSFSQLFKLKDYRSVILPMGVIVGALSFLAFKNSPELSYFLSKVWGPYSLSIELGLPLLLLLALLIKKIKAKI